MSESKKPAPQLTTVRWGIIGIGVPAMMFIWLIPVLFLRGCFAEDVELKLYNAAASGDMATVKNLVNLGVYVDGKDMEGSPMSTPLIAASAEGYTEIVRFLIDHHAKVNRWDNDTTGALHKAIEYHHPDIVRLLKAAGAKE